MRFAISLPNADHFGDVRAVVRLAALAESQGWDGFFLWDHILFSEDPPVDVIEPWTALAAIAAVTERITIGTLITPPARYEPWALARTITTLDQLCGGRVLFGVGRGTPEADFVSFWSDTVEAETKARGSRYIESLEILPSLLAGDPVDHSGRNFTVRDVTLLPGAFGGRTIPIWIGGSHTNRNALDRAREHAGAIPLAWGDDGWPRAMTSSEVAGYRADLGPAGDYAYWNQTEIDPLSPERALEMEGAGATWWIETTKTGRPARTRSESLDLIEERIKSLASMTP